MTQFTPVYAFPYPENTDAPDGPNNIHNGLLAVENELVADLAPLKSASNATKTPTIFTSSSTLAATVYPNAKALRIEGCNGGGGAGGAATNASGSSMGGPACGGAYAVKTVLVSALTFPLTVTVGAGGTAGANTGTAGGTGGQSSVTNGATTYWTPGAQTGNQKGLGGASSTSLGDASTPGFDGSTTGNVSDVVVPGGQPSGVPTRYSSTLITRQYGGGSVLGVGGVPGNNTAGTQGGGFGGGGGPGYSNNATGQAGGAGSGGIVIITPIY